MQTYSVNNIIVGSGDYDEAEAEVEGEEKLIKGGYSAYELLKTIENEYKPSLIEGGGIDTNSLVVSDGLKEMLKDLHIPVGLVTKHYRPIVGGHYTHDVDTPIAKNIIESLESQVFVSKHSNGGSSEKTRKNDNVISDAKKTRKNTTKNI